MHVTLTFTGDGLLAFAGGALALFGVWWSNHQSVKNLQEQMDAEKRSRAEEQEQRARAVATGILFEIDYFHLHYVRGVREYIKDLARRSELLEVVRVPPSLFAVYQANAGTFGNLPPEVVRAVVHFYSKAAQFLALREDYRAERESHKDLAKAATLYGHLRDSLPGLARAGYIACEKLCSMTGLAFEPPGIAVAGEDITTLNRETERIEHEEVHRI